MPTRNDHPAVLPGVRRFCSLALTSTLAACSGLCLALPLLLSPPSLQAACRNPEQLQPYLQRDLAALNRLLRTSASPSLERLQISYLTVLTAFASGDRDAAEDALELGIKSFKASKSKSAEIYALGSLLYGQQLRLKPYLGVFHGGKPQEYIESAKQLAPEVLVVFAEASFYQHTPRNFGGSLSRAIQHHQRGLNELSDGSAISCWLRPLMQQQLAQAYQAGGDQAAAEELLEQARQEYPDNRWLAAKSASVSPAGSR